MKFKAHVELLYGLQRCSVLSFIDSGVCTDCQCQLRFLYVT